MHKIIYEKPLRLGLSQIRRDYEEEREGRPVRLKGNSLLRNCYHRHCHTFNVFSEGRKIRGVKGGGEIWVKKKM